jgi:hypothetical protein
MFVNLGIPVTHASSPLTNPFSKKRRRTSEGWCPSRLRWGDHNYGDKYITPHPQFPFPKTPAHS